LNDFFNVVEKVRTTVGGGPTFMTEFGLCLRNGTNTDLCDFVLSSSDTRFTSWTYWDSDFYDEDFYVNQHLVNTFSRVYPMATNGIPVKFEYNSTAKSFNYDYNLDLSRSDLASLPTEIFVPLTVYPGGFQVQVSSNLNWKFDMSSSRVLVYAVDLNASSGFQPANVVIQKK
jgi:hypothetical protein